MDKLAALKKIKNLDEFSVFLKIFELNTNIAEVGVFRGANIKRFKKADPKLLVCVDPWGLHDGHGHISQKKMQFIYNNLSKKFADDPTVKLVRDYSTNAATTFDDSFFDVVYIDANHSYATAKEDISLWWKKVKSGGILCGHDYKNSSGVKIAVNEFVKEQRVELCKSKIDWAIAKP